MTYKTDLQSNNIDLQSILDMILALGLVDAPPTPPPNYLTFKSNNEFTLSAPSGCWDDSMYYSLNAKDWIEWSGSSVTSKTIYMRGKGNTVFTNGSIFGGFKIEGSNVICEGNILTLLDYETVSAGGSPTMGKSCFAYLFSGCTSLIKAPELPATTLSQNCYDSMFRDCTNLTTVPELPATILAQDCYNTMFHNCTKIKLSATSTAEYTKAYRIPTSETGYTASGALTDMFSSTGGTFTGTPSINTTYYLHESNSIV